MKRTLLNLTIALRSLANFKMRTALAVLGVFFGTFSLIVVSNLAASLAVKTAPEIDNPGTTLIVIVSGQLRRFGPSPSLISRSTNLKPSDAEAIAQSLPAAAQVSPSGFKAFPVRRGDTGLKATAGNGGPAHFRHVRNLR